MPSRRGRASVSDVMLLYIVHSVIDVMLLLLVFIDYLCTYRISSNKHCTSNSSHPRIVAALQ